MKFSVLIVSGMILALPAGQLSALPIKIESEPQDTAQIISANPAEDYYQEGLKFLVADKPDQAQQAFRNSLNRSPSLAKSMLGLAEAAFRQNNLEESERWIKKAAEQAPDDPHVQTSMGRLLYLQGDFAGAEAAFLKALEIDSEMIGTRIALGDLYLMALKRPEDAIRTYRKALETNSEHAGAHYALGMALLASGETEKAKAELLTAAKQAPENPLPLFSLGNIAASQQESEEAEQYYTRVLAIDSTNIKSLVRRGDIYLNMGNDDAAIRDYEAALAINDQLTDVYVKLGMLYQKHDHYDRAKKAYQQAITLNTNSALAYNNMAWMAAESGSDLDRAVGWGKKATELAPESFGVFDTLGWVYRARKEYDLAISSIQKAAELNPESTIVFYHLGLTYMEQGNNAQAASALNKVLSLDSKSQDAVLARELLAKIKTN